MKRIEFTPEEIAKIANGRIKGKTTEKLIGLNRIEEASIGELTFFSDNKFSKYIGTTKASCIIVPDSFEGEPSENQVYILSGDPYKAFVNLLMKIDAAKEKPKNGIHPSASYDKSSRIDSSAHIGPNCVIGKNCKIGKNVVLFAGTVLYDDVEIGDGTLLHANVTCYSETKIASNCIIHSGAVIGSDGFGYIEHKDGSYQKIPQIGNVVIEDNVEIGDNTTIDRAAFGSTIIEKGVKLDNLIQIGHNCKVGENSAMSSLTGLSGSTKVGKRNRFGGQVGTAGHLETADDVVLLAQSGVAKSVEEKGIYFGTPIRKRLDAFKIEAALNSLPKLMRDFYKLKKIIEEKLK